MPTPQTAGRIFFDTNVLVYQFDQSALRKRAIAMALVKQHLRDQQGCISTQVVQEFLNVALSKFRQVLPAEELPNVVNDLLNPLCRQYPSLGFYERALQLHAEHSLNFYDALIVQAALDLGCIKLYSEDLHAGQKFSKLTVVNPFK